MDTDQNSPQNSKKRDTALSKDGQWRSFPNVPCLLQYVNNGNYYGRIRVNGKLIRESLNTTVWSAAKLKLVDFLKEHREAKSVLKSPKFIESLELFTRDLESATNIKESSKQYRRDCIKKLQTTWPELWEMHIEDIPADGCKEWGSKLSKEIAGQYYNNMLGTLRMIIDRGIKEHKKNTKIILENPAMEVQRVKAKPADLKLPTPAQFDALIENLRKKSGGWGPRVADLAEFLAYSGMRVYSEAAWVEWNDVNWPQMEIIVRGDPVTATKNGETRRIPIITRMEKLLRRLQKEAKGEKSERILKVSRGYESLARACKEVGIPKLNHKALRHLFGTYCIEAGVDVPTVADWLGHKDRGVLAMQTYRHHRNEHSQAMAKKVAF